MRLDIYVQLTMMKVSGKKESVVFFKVIESGYWIYPLKSFIWSDLIYQSKSYLSHQAFSSVILQNHEHV